MLKASLARTLLNLCLALFITVCALSKPLYADPGDSTLYYLSHVTGTPGDTHFVTFGINTVHDIGGFSFVLAHEGGTLDPQEFDYEGTRSDGIDIWGSGLLLYKPWLIRGSTFYQPPGFVPAGDGPIATLVMVSDADIPNGSLLPLSFFWTGSPYWANAMADPEGLYDYLPDFNHGSILFPIGSPEGMFDLGDVNLNGIAYELADMVLMQTQLAEGIGSYIDENMQSRTADVDQDGLPWTVADLLMEKGVVVGNLLPLPEEYPNSIIHLPEDSIWYTGYDGTPTDTLEIPIYFSNGLDAGGVSFRVEYPFQALEFVSWSTEGGRMPPEWDLVSVYERDSGLMVYATTGIEDPDTHLLAPGDGLLMTLEFAVLNPPENLLDFHFERLQNFGQANGYATFDDPLWRFASFQQVENDIYFSFLYGDANGSGWIDIDDVVYLIAYIFASGPTPQPYETGDFNRDFFVDIDDVVALIAYIFG